MPGRGPRPRRRRQRLGRQPLWPVMTRSPLAGFARSPRETTSSPRCGDSHVHIPSAWLTGVVDHASGFRTRSPGAFTNRSSRVHSSVAPPSMAHRAICRSNTRGPRTFRSTAVCTSRAANPGPEVNTTTPPSSSSARRNRAASSGLDGPPSAAGCVDDAPEFGDRLFRHAATAARVARLLDRALSGSVLRGPPPVRIHEQIRVDCDHASRPRESCIVARSATSTPGGSPPATVTHPIATRRRRPRSRSSGRRRSSARSPRSTSSRSGRRISAARFFAATTRSSGSSTVAFIQETVTPYSRIRKRNRTAAGRSCASPESRPAENP